MDFVVIPDRTRRPDSTGPRRAFLLVDNWDDWGKYGTMYTLYVREKDILHSIGSVKIGSAAMTEDTYRPTIDSSFETLDEEFFSLGQEREYYENLNRLGEETRDEILNALRDVAASEELFDKVEHLPVTQLSLLRSVSTKAVRGQYRRLSRGQVVLTRYAFIFRILQVATRRKQVPTPPPVDLSFNVHPYANPPTNLHVIIGRNGVGKTTLLEDIARSAIDERREDRGLIGELVS